MDFPKPIYIVVAGAVVFNSTLGVSDIPHPIHEVYPNQNVITIFATGTAGGIVFVSGDKVIT